MPLRLPPSLVLLLALPSAAQAQDAGMQDPQLVLTRRVQPRIAYHALPRKENPVSAQAPVFAARAFGTAIAGVNGAVAIGAVDDSVLGALGAGGLDGRHGPVPVAALASGPGLGPASRGTAPLGLSGTLGSVGHVTSGVGDLVNRTLSQALGAGGHP